MVGACWEPGLGNAGISSPKVTRALTPPLADSGSGAEKASLALPLKRPPSLLLTGAHLHGDVELLRGHTLQGLVVAAAPAPHQGHAGRLEDVLDLIGVLLEDVHQGLDRTAVAALVDIHELHHCVGGDETSDRQVTQRRPVPGSTGLCEATPQGFRERHPLLGKSFHNSNVRPSRRGGSPPLSVPPTLRKACFCAAGRRALPGPAGDRLPYLTPASL